MKKLLLGTLLASCTMIHAQDFPGQIISLKNAQLPFDQHLRHLPTEEATYCAQAQIKISQRQPSPREKLFLDTFMSFSEFMEQTNQEYYGKHVLFKPVDKGGHFLTVPQLISPAFGRMLANQAYAMWQSMVKSGDTTGQEPFYLIEFGAGDGDLAHDILDGISFNAQQERLYNLATYWSDFYNVVTYVIGERSTELCSRQTRKNQRFIDEKKLKIINTDAREAKQHFPTKVKGTVITNELLDTFSLHKAYVQDDGSFKIGITIPLLNPAFFQENTVPQWLEFKDFITNNHQFYCAQFNEFFSQISIRDHELTLGKLDYIYLKMHEMAGLITVTQHLRFEEIFIDASLIFEPMKYLAQHGNYLTKQVQTRDKSRKRIFYLNHTAPQFIKAAESLLEKGFIITIDYGDTSMMHCWQLDDPFTAIRMYPERIGCYDRAGSADITSDVNFTDLYLAGKELNLGVAFYGDQRALNGTYTQITPDEATPPFDIKNTTFSPKLSDDLVNYFCNTPNSAMFKMLIHKKVSPNNYYKLLVPSNSLFPSPLNN